MLAAALAAMAMTAAVMGVIVGMLMAMGVVVSVLMGMGVVMFMVVAAAGDVIVMNMHIVSPLCFSFIIPAVRDSVKTFIFAEISPLWACATVEKGV
jgi:hypothetical protein